MKINQYLIEAHKNGTWTLRYSDNAHVLTYDVAMRAFDAMLKGVEHDFPDGTIFRIEILTEKMKPAVLRKS